MRITQVLNNLIFIAINFSEKKSCIKIDQNFDEESKDLHVTVNYIGNDIEEKDDDDIFTQTNLYDDSEKGNNLRAYLISKRICLESKGVIQHTKTINGNINLFFSMPCKKVSLEDSRVRQDNNDIEE